MWGKEAGTIALEFCKSNRMGLFPLIYFYLTSSRSGGVPLRRYKSDQPFPTLESACTC